MPPNCTPALQGPSRLSQASSGGMPPLAADDDHATIFTYEEFDALVSGDCEMMSFSEDDELQPPPLSTRGDDAQFQAPLFSEEAVRHNAQLFSIDDLQAPLSEDEAEMLAEMLCDEEIAAIFSNQQPRAPRSGGKAGNKRKSRPPQRRFSDDAELLQVPPKRARMKAEEAAKRRAWQRRIAAEILNHQSKPSRGRTALRCQCAELAAAAAPGSGRDCALHQDVASAGAEWMCAKRRRVPRVGGRGKVVVPRLCRGDTIATVAQYAHWRRSVWMPTRFYVERAAERGVDAWLNKHYATAG